MSTITGTTVRTSRAGRFGTRLFSEHLIWVVLAVVLLFGVTVQGFLTQVNLLNVLWAAAPLGLTAIGMFVIMLAGHIDLSLESTFGFASMIAVLLMTEWMADLVPGWVGVIVVLLVGLLVGLANGVMAILGKVTPFLITLATMLILRGIMIFLIPEGVYFLPDDFTFLGRARIGDVPVAVVVFAITYVVAYVVMGSHSFGKSIQAIGSSPRAAHIAGIRVNRNLVLAFGLGGLFAALGGLIQVGRTQAVSADTGQGSIMLVIAAVILGGTSMTGGHGRLTGVAGAVLVLATVENLLNLIGVDPSIRQVVYGLILLGGIYLASFQDRLRERVA
jgi:simple sugar transport system permease protein